MKKILLFGIALVCLSASATQSTECDFDLKIHGAKYLVTKKLQGTQEIAKQYKVNLWRYRDQVAYEYPQKQLTEIWNLVSNGQIRPVRLFDEFKRGIEYQPLEVNEGKGDKNWSAKFQLVDQNLLAKLKINKTEKEGCYTRSERVGEEKNNKLNLVWLEHVKLPRELTVEYGKTVEHWQLISIEKDKQEVDKVFKQRENYHLTDYADIGDNESDPFLLKMVNVGFASAKGPVDTDNTMTRVKQHSHGHAHH